MLISASDWDSQGARPLCSWQEFLSSTACLLHPDILAFTTEECALLKIKALGGCTSLNPKSHSQPKSLSPSPSMLALERLNIPICILKEAQLH